MESRLRLEPAWLRPVSVCLFSWSCSLSLARRTLLQRECCSQGLQWSCLSTLKKELNGLHLKTWCEGAYHLDLDHTSVRSLNVLRELLGRMIYWFVKWKYTSNGGLQLFQWLSPIITQFVTFPQAASKHLGFVHEGKLLVLIESYTLT